MSWGVSTQALPEQVADRVEALVAPGSEFPERDDQLKAAKAAAIAIIDSGALGKGEAFTISLGGHANPNHEPAQGYVNDSITISISQTNAASVSQYDAYQAAAQRNLE